MYSVFENIFINQLMSEERTYVFFGCCLTSEDKSEMSKRFAKKKVSFEAEFHAEPAERRKRVVEHALLDFYHNEDEMKTLRNKYKSKKYEHGIALGVELDHSVYLYDNGNKKRHQVHSIIDVVPYLFTFWRVFVFKMVV